MQIGDAQISNKHANFIINHGNATSNDIIQLIKIIKKEVLNQFHINLELEVRLMGFKKAEIEGIT